MREFPIVLGLDLSLAATGWAILASHVSGTADHGVIPTTANRDDPDDTIVRAELIRDRVVDVAEVAGGPDLLVVEDLPRGVKHGGVQLGHVHQAVRGELRRLRWPVALVPPSNVKRYATGRGNAGKADLRVELVKRAGIDVRDDNACDAWWLAAMGLDQLGRPPLVMPAAHRTALAGCRWPQGVPTP